jgi:hypothetical protein
MLWLKDTECLIQSCSVLCLRLGNARYCIRFVKKCGARPTLRLRLMPSNDVMIRFLCLESAEGHRFVGAGKAASNMSGNHQSRTLTWNIRPLASTQDITVTQAMTTQPHPIVEFSYSESEYRGSECKCGGTIGQTFRWKVDINVLTKSQTAVTGDLPAGHVYVAIL